MATPLAIAAGTARMHIRVTAGAAAFHLRELQCVTLGATQRAMNSLQGPAALFAVVEIESRGQGSPGLGTVTGRAGHALEVAVGISPGVRSVLCTPDGPGSEQKETQSQQRQTCRKAGVHGSFLKIDREPLF